jgi:hypothetical protein
MKTRTIIMAVAMGLTMQALAAGTDNGPSASTNIRKTTLPHRVYDLLQPKTPVKSDKIERVGGISSRPWAQTVGFSGSPTPFAGDLERFHNPRFNLFWIGARPD